MSSDWNEDDARARFRTCANDERPARFSADHARGVIWLCATCADVEEDVDDLQEVSQ